VFLREAPPHAMRPHLPPKLPHNLATILRDLPHVSCHHWPPTEWRCELVLHGETPPRSDFSYDGPEELLTEVIRYHKSIDKDIRNGSFDVTWAQYASDGVRLREVIEKRFEVRRVDKCLVADDHEDGPLEYTIWLKRYE
jgi:hypothetical protein